MRYILELPDNRELSLQSRKSLLSDDALLISIPNAKQLALPDGHSVSEKEFEMFILSTQTENTSKEEDVIIRKILA